MSLATRRETATRKARQRHRWRKPPLYIKHILAWADEHLAETGRWPMKDSGRVRGDHDERWSSIDMALRAGARGLPGGDSLARVLARYRGVRNRKALPPYSLKQILNWADAHRGRRGRWPMKTSGPIDAASGETWMAVEVALRNGQRGLNGGSSLSQLLAARRNVRNMNAADFGRPFSPVQLPMPLTRPGLRSIRPCVMARAACAADRRSPGCFISVVEWP